jgi:hypothetical protein
MTTWTFAFLVFVVCVAVGFAGDYLERRFEKTPEQLEAEIRETIALENTLAVQRARAERARRRGGMTR